MKKECKSYKYNAKNSYISSKNFLVAQGAIDKYLNILDLNGFRKEVVELTKLAKNKHNVDKGLLFGERTIYSADKSYFQAVPNKDAFSEIDKVKTTAQPQAQSQEDLDDYYMGDEPLRFQEEKDDDKFYQEAGKALQKLSSNNLEKLNVEDIKDLQSTVEYQLLKEQDDDLGYKGGQSYVFLNTKDAERFGALLKRNKEFPTEFKVTKKITKYEKDPSNLLNRLPFNEYKDYYYIKSNKNKKSNLYNIVDKETGELIASKIRVIHLKKDVKSEIAEKYGLEFTPTKVFNANRSIAFVLYREKPSKAKYVAQAKKYLYDALKFLNPSEGGQKINLDKIEGFLDAFPDDMWDYINTTYSPEDTTNINASISLRDKVLFSLPKLGLIEEIEKVTGIKLKDVAFTNYDRTGTLQKVLKVEWKGIVVIDPALSKKELRAAINYYLKSKNYFKPTSEQENVRKYAEHRGIDYEELKKLVFGSIDEAIENISYNNTGNSDEMEVSKWRESVRNYDWQYAELYDNLYKNYNERVKERVTEKFKDKKLSNGISHLDYFFSGNFNWLNINFNNISGQYYDADMENKSYRVGVTRQMKGIINPFEMITYRKPTAGKDFLKEEEVFNRLGAILHEPFHALHALSYGTKEEKALRKAFDNLYNTAFGKELMDQVFGSGYNKGQQVSYDVLYKEFTAFTTQLMLYPKQWIKNTDLRSNDIYDFIEKVQTLQDKTYTEIVSTKQKIGTTETNMQETEVIKLSFLEALYNFIVKALNNIIPLSKKFTKVIETSKLVDKTVIEDVFADVEEVVTKTKPLPEQVKKAKEEFLQAMDELKSGINTLMQIDSKLFSSENIKSFFTKEQFYQEAESVSTPETTQNQELFLYLSKEMSDKLGYNNPGSTAAPSIKDIITRIPVINQTDIDNKKLEC